MTQKKKKQVAKSAPQGKGYNSLLIILVSLILIAIPVWMIGRVIYESYMEGGVPIPAERFEGDIATTISEEQLTQLKTNLTNLAYVESVEINLQSATLKIQVDMKNELTVEELNTLHPEVYATIVGVLPAETYFTQTGEMRNYDLEVSMFNNPETLDVYGILVKNSMMAAPKLNVISSPLDPATTTQVLENVVPEVDPNAPAPETPPVETPAEEVPTETPAP